MFTCGTLTYVLNDFEIAMTSYHLYTHPNQIPSYAPAYTRGAQNNSACCFSCEYYQVIIATHLPITEGWKAELK